MTQVLLFISLSSSNLKSRRLLSWLQGEKSWEMCALILDSVPLLWRRCGAKSWFDVLWTSLLHSSPFPTQCACKSKLICPTQMKWQLAICPTWSKSLQACGYFPVLQFENTVSHSAQRLLCSVASERRVPGLQMLLSVLVVAGVLLRPIRLWFSYHSLSWPRQPCSHFIKARDKNECWQLEKSLLLGVVLHPRRLRCHGGVGGGGFLRSSLRPHTWGVQFLLGFTSSLGDPGSVSTTVCLQSMQFSGQILCILV